MGKTECLLLKTKDNRRFFTLPQNAHQLLEFSRTFGADMSIVKIESPNLPIMALSDIAPAICNPGYKSPEVGEIEIVEPVTTNSLPPFEYVLNETKEPEKKPTMNPRQTAEMIRNHIRKSFLKYKVVDVQNVAKAFSDSGLRLYTISSHIRRVRDELLDEGHPVVKIGTGQYKLM